MGGLVRNKIGERHETGLSPIWLKVVYTFYFFEPQNIEQGMSNVEVPHSKFCGSLFCGSIFKIDD